jgi:membrane protein implicated in regulation of membrane protease activity
MAISGPTRAKLAAAGALVVALGVTSLLSPGPLVGFQNDPWLSWVFLAFGSALTVRAVWPSSRFDDDRGDQANDRGQRHRG